MAETEKMWRVKSEKGYQIEQEDVGDGPHATILCQCDDDQRVADHRQEEDDGVERNHHFRTEATSTGSWNDWTANSRDLDSGDGAIGHVIKEADIVKRPKRGPLFR